MKAHRFFEFCLPGLLLLMLPAVSLAVIENSVHDLSGRAWNSTAEICVPCHVPHSALQTTLLWNRDLPSDTTFTIYNSATMEFAPDLPSFRSLLCLGCHDGSIAVDQYGDFAGGAEYVGGTAQIGPDLSQSHPISLLWQHQPAVDGNLTCFQCHQTSPMAFVSPLTFPDGYIECETCHDVHNGEPNPFLLRMPLAQSEICLHCHAK